jgi:hypothetical protein
MTMSLEGSATFLRLPKLAAALEQIPPNTELHVHFDDLSYIDHACLDLLMNWEKQHRAQGGTLVVDWDGLTARFRDHRSRHQQAVVKHHGPSPLPALQSGSEQTAA